MFVGFHSVEPPQDLHTVDHSSEDGRLLIQTLTGGQRDVELRFVHVRAGVRRCDHAGQMVQIRIDLVGKVAAVDRVATASGTSRIAGLQDLVLDYPMNDGVVIVLSIGEGGEVSAGVRCATPEQLDGEFALA